MDEEHFAHHSERCSNRLRAHRKCDIQQRGDPKWHGLDHGGRHSRLWAWRVRCLSVAATTQLYGLHRHSQQRRLRFGGLWQQLGVRRKFHLHPRQAQHQDRLRASPLATKSDHLGPGRRHFLLHRRVYGQSGRSSRDRQRAGRLSAKRAIQRRTLYPAGLVL